MNILSPYRHFDLSAIESCSEIPACRGPEVLAILVEVDPVTNAEKDYPERVEKFSGNYICRMLTNDITIEFIEAAVERMFNADEVTSVVDAAKLRRIKYQIVSLFLKL